jgi:hypothetical protein
MQIETMQIAEGDIYSLLGCSSGQAATSLGGLRSSGADGSDPIPLTDNSAQDSFPSWSSDGTTIAFQSDRDGDADIYIMNTAGGGVRQLTNDPRRISCPTGHQTAPCRRYRVPATVISRST